ncbi:MAG: hypothetical protein [Cotesia congregata filamentous virus 2]
MDSHINNYTVISSSLSSHVFNLINLFEYSRTYKLNTNKNIKLIKNPLMYYNIETFYHIKTDIYPIHINSAIKTDFTIKSVYDHKGIFIESVDELKFIFYNKTMITDLNERSRLCGSAVYSIPSEQKNCFQKIKLKSQRISWSWNLLINDEYIFKIKFYNNHLRISCNDYNISQYDFSKIYSVLLEHYRQQFILHPKYLYSLNDNFFNDPIVLTLIGTVKLISNVHSDAINSLLMLNTYG